MASFTPPPDQLVGSIPLFSLLDEEERKTMASVLNPVSLQSGQVLFRQGAPGEAMWVLGAGVEVSISTTPVNGQRSVVVAYNKEGAVVGEMALIDDGPRSGTAMVIQGGPAYRIDSADFDRLRHQYEPPAYKVLRWLCVELCRKLRATRDRIVGAGTAEVQTPPLPVGTVPSESVLNEHPFFHQLPAVVKLALAQKLRVVELPSVTPLFAEGEVADAAYFLIAGEVTLGRNGRTLANLGPGSMFGLVSAIDEGTRSASAVTTGPTRMLRLSDADFDALFAKGNRFAFRLVDLVARQLVSHIRAANQMLRLPGQAPAAAPPPRSPAGIDDVLPLEFELELEELPEPRA